MEPTVTPTTAAGAPEAPDLSRPATLRPRAAKGPRRSLLDEAPVERTATAPVRARVVRLALRFSWVVVAVLVLVAARIGIVDRPEVAGPLLGAGLASLLLAFVRWEDRFAEGRGGLLLGLWFGTLLSAIVSLSFVPGLSRLALALYFGVVVFSAVVASPIRHAVVTLICAIAYVAPYLVNGAVRPLEDLLVPLLTLLIVGTVAGIVGRELRRSIAESAVRLEELGRRESDFRRLYEVSRTLAAGEDAETVLPQLVGRIGSYLDAQVGVVLLHDPHRSVLEVVSPIWTSGHLLDVEGYTIADSGPGEIERVFRSGHPARWMRLDEAGRREGLLYELGVSSAMAAPLTVQGRRFGVLVVADSEHGEFTEHQLEEFASLAAAAALVVSQLERFRQAQETTRRLQELAELKSDFVSVVSHELRTPLTSIRGILDTLQRPELAPTDERARKLLDSAAAQARRLQRLIEDLLVTSRLEAGTLPLHPEEMRLEDLVRDVVATVREPDRVAMDVSPAHMTVFTDPDHLRRIVTNLVENALKYAPGSPVEVVGRRGPGSVVIQVVDHGPGIPAERSEEVFERFRQLDSSSTRSRGGAGLGLAIVRGLVEALGGRIELRATPGGGATFVITLPRRPGARPPGAEPINPPM